MAERLEAYSDFEDCGYYIVGTGKLFLSQGKKLKNIYPLIYSTQNLIYSQYTAQKGKAGRREVENFNENLSENLANLYEFLRDGTYIPGKYRKKIIYEPKERVIMIAPFYPDRIIHHCIINVLGPHWVHLFIANTYACIKGRGIDKCINDVNKALMSDRKNTQYCLKTDIKKFYDNVDHEALKSIIRLTIADERLLVLIDTIIDSNGQKKGLVIGSFTSQYFANLYLTPFDHWVKEGLSAIVMDKFGVTFYYFRYMDDMVVLCSDKEALHFILDMMGLYLGAELKVEFKHNWQIFKVDDRCIDYVGVKQSHYGILLRKSILLRFYKKLEKTQKKYIIKDENDIKHLFPSEYGWIIKCSDKHKQFIFNKCYNNGKDKHFNDGSVVEDKAAGNRRLEQRTGNVPLQPQH